MEPILKSNFSIIYLIIYVNNHIKYCKLIRFGKKKKRVSSDSKIYMWRKKSFITCEIYVYYTNILNVIIVHLLIVWVSDFTLFQSIIRKKKTHNFNFNCIIVIWNILFYIYMSALFALNALKHDYCRLLHRWEMQHKK